MYRGRPPPRGAYRPPFEGRGPPPSRPYPPPADYRDDRNRPRPPYHPGYHGHGQPDAYRRSPPRRMYPSPGSGSHPGADYWAGGSPNKRSLSPRGALDHNLVITVGNELTGPSGSTSSRPHDRDYPPRPEYERSKSRGRSRPRSQSRSPDRGRAKSRGRSKSRPRSKSRARSKSRPGSRSRSIDRGRAKSRGRSRSRSTDRNRAKSRGRSRSRSTDRSRAKSRGRSRSRSADRSRAKSRGRSKSRHHSRSRSRSRSGSRGRSYGKAASRGRSKSRRRSRSSSSSSSSSNSNDGEGKSGKEFRELQTARRRKELEELLCQPTKSILKKRNDSEDSPSVRSLDSPRGAEGSSISRMADQLLNAVKGMEPHMVATMLSELRSDPHMAQRAGLDLELKEILNLLGSQAAGAKAEEKSLDDIDDEEKFLYGDAEEPNPTPSAEPIRHHGLDLYGDVTEEALYGDYPPQMTTSSHVYGIPPGEASHLSVPPTMTEVDMRYASQPVISPEQNIPHHASNPAYLPGTEPLEESERKAVEEYEKIQDLLKTIGLDLGVTEISKMAARTRERLHGSKPPPKTPTRRRYSSGSSDDSRRSRGRKRRSHSSSSSSSSSRSQSGARGASWSSDDSRKKTLAPSKSHKERDSKETKPERKTPLPIPAPQTTDPNSLPPQAGAPIPTYPPPQVHNMMPPNYPPPGYGQYGNYLPYMHQQWPPMYPPPMTIPPPSGPEEFPPTMPYHQPYSKPTPEPAPKGRPDQGLGKSSAQDVEKHEGGAKKSSHDRRFSEEENNESQKQKVLEEREKLKQERELRMKKKEYLMKELERLRKQQGELLRKKRRERDGHKDPLLQEISHLQEEVMAQISNLRKEHEAAEKKRSEIEKVALILGLDPSDRPRKISKPAEDQEEQPSKLISPPEKKKRMTERSPERQQAPASSPIKTSAEPAPAPKASVDKSLASALPAPPSVPPPEPFDYYDAGNHWCKNCNVTSGSMFDFFTHLHSKSHRKTLDPYDRPWASTPTKISKKSSSEEKLTKPAKGSEFLLPVRGFFCLLCKEFFGDAICAEEHVTTHNHNENYKKQMYENPLYEQRRNLDRQAGLALETSGKKRKHDDEKSSKDKEEKAKHKKEKKEKEKKKDDDGSDQKEDKYKSKKEEPEEKPKPVKKEQDYRDAERPAYSKKDESEKSKFSKKNEKYRSREEEEMGKYSKREEEDRYKYDREEDYRYRYRKDEVDRHDDYPKYGPRDDEDRLKHSKYPDFRSKNDREREEGKPKAQREGFKKPGAEKPGAKPEVIRPELPPKPYELPKVFCGPSPAMRAKLRKQNQEVGKPANLAGTTSFGKFTWKKRENVLAKEAQKAAAEFLKEDEDVAQQKVTSVEDSFAKSMAVAKEIAEKIGGPSNMPPPWVSNYGNRGRIRPNLRAPAAVMRKAAMMGRPAPLNTFLSIRPQNQSILGAPANLPPFREMADAMCLPNSDPSATSTAGPQAFGLPTAPFTSMPDASKANTNLPVSEPAPEAKLASVVSKPAENKNQQSMSKPADVKTPQTPSKPVETDIKAPQPMSKPAPIGVQPPLTVSKPAIIDAKPALSDCRPKPFQVSSAPLFVTTPAPTAIKPTQPAMMKFMPDVAAPGVPESEQTHAVFVKPPPIMKKSEGAQKSEKLRSNLAAAKAKDLFDIFYSSIGQSNSSSVTKSTDKKADCSTNKSVPATPQTPKTQPPISKSPAPSVVCTIPQPNSTISSPNSQAQPKADKHPLSSQTQPEVDKNPPNQQIKPEVEKNQPSSQTQPEVDKNPPSPHIKPETDKNPPISQTKSEAVKNPPSSQIQMEANENPVSPQIQPESELKISSVWSLQSPISEGAPSEKKTKTNQSDPPSSDEAQNSIPKPAPHITAQMDAELETASQSQSQPIQTDLQSETQDSQSHSDSEIPLDAAPVPETKTGRKTRGKATPAKKATPATRPVRQTRSQTRYQTRNQQHSQSEPELASGDSDSAASDAKGLDTSDPGPELEAEEAAASEGDSQATEITPETLGLPPDMASLDFDYNFSFE